MTFHSYEKKRQKLGKKIIIVQGKYTFLSEFWGKKIILIHTIKYQSVARFQNFNSIKTQKKKMFFPQMIRFENRLTTNGIGFTVAYHGFC